jgi:uncharacterized protein YbjT (DUF2867 family)
VPEPEEVNKGSDEGALHVAVLGGSGFIGTYLVLDLLRMGYRINLLVNKTNPDFVSPRGTIKIFNGSIENDVALAECLGGCKVVYHLVGLIAETRDKTFRKTVAEGTAKVVAAAKSKGVEKIIYLSALGTEENAESLYYRTKYEAEQHVINSGLDYTVFRSSVVYGSRDKFINRIARMIRLSPLVPVIGDGLYKLQPVYVEELCTIMAITPQKSFTSRRIYDIGGPQQLTYMEIVDIVKRVLGRRRGKIHVPLWVVRAAAAIMEKLFQPAPLTVDQLKMMQIGTTCDHTVAEKEFGVKFSPLEIQLQKYLRK